MHGVIADIAAPKTGGSYKPVPTQPPSGRTRAKGRPPLYLTTARKCGGFPRPRPKNNKTNPISTRTTTQIRETNPIYPRRHHRLCETNPIAAQPKTQIRKTNPITAYQVSRQPRFLRNEPNLPPWSPCPAPKIRNEPNCSRGGSVEDQKCETNPIPVPRPVYFPGWTFRRELVCCLR